MKTIVVTGGSGKLGSAVIQGLIDKKYRVLSLDNRHSPTLPCTQILVDMNDLGQVTSALEGADAILHLAAIPAPLGYPQSYIFANNVLGGYHVLQAASLLGIRKMVLGSSTSCYGIAWAPGPLSPRYLPIDESHPHLAEEVYGLSKTINEKTAEMFARRDGIQTISLRFSMIMTPDSYEGAGESIRKPERLQKILWSYIDIRDAVEACIAALETDAKGRAFALNITGDDTLSDRSTEELLREFYPEVPDLAGLRGSDPLFSNAKAKEVLGWKPKHSWRTQR
ncbi:NAD-dependent epimerase/dehydratase family protein [Cohnella thailandensis]|uniref:NAD(P)-dependent oxidoreductase n=1 Tax=Cohnella thailandensis TaxID=557557 RepID=A0A841SYE4_9BACL|nr:NAD(P)-dependent oxidoreductase [Cohnella thailandensis]MBB6637243.1 NAD(P)-dependent oxidoreductase [Cohnella thailandensis]MBP1976918.1 nucleoside-diphosphate-sugar epimerase [Cohnella thailandensis]